MAVLRWTQTAADDLEEILNFTARQFPGYERILADALMNFLKKQLLPHPWAGKIVPEYQNERIRERVFKKYRIVYKILDDADAAVVELQTMFHGSRQFFR